MVPAPVCVLGMETLQVQALISVLWVSMAIFKDMLLVAVILNGCSYFYCVDFSSPPADAGVHVFKGSPRGNSPNNSLVVYDNVGSGFRSRVYCRSDSMSANVGEFIGLDGTTALNSNNLFAIARPQPGEITIENIVGSQSALTASQQGVYCCRIPLQSGVIREFNIGMYPSGFNSELLL